MATVFELQARYDALDEAIAAGATRVAYDGKSVDYRSLDEMKSIRSELASQIAGTPRRKMQRVATRRGY